MKPASGHRFWPGYIPPLKDELFSSWYTRLCYEHRIKSISFSKHYFEGHPIWNRDIDRMFPAIIKKVLLERTPLVIEDIRKMFLISYDGKVFNGPGVNGINTSILNLGVKHRMRKLHGQLFCPDCLDKRIPYYRKHWRLVTSVACTDCRLLLEDRCPYCGEPIAFHRLETGYKSSLLKYPLYKCWKCLKDLRSMKNPIQIGSPLYRIQSLFDQTLKDGYNQYSPYSFLFFEIIAKLRAKLLSKSSQWGRMRIAAEKEFHIGLTEPGRIGIYHALKYRRNSLMVSQMLLEDWPFTFVGFIKKYGLRLSDFYHLSDDCPSWFKRVFRENL